MFCYVTSLYAGADLGFGRGVSVSRSHICHSIYEPGGRIHVQCKPYSDASMRLTVHSITC